jgi:hypothetical protein
MKRNNRGDKKLDLLKTTYCTHPGRIEGKVRGRFKVREELIKYDFEYDRRDTKGAANFNDR